MLMLTKTSAYLKSCYRQTQWMYFMIDDDGLLKNTIIFGIK